jgi:hypothetical protein
MTQGPRDIVHGLSCLLASVSSGNSKSLALLQSKMTATNGRFQRIPRLIELEDDLDRSPVSLEAVSANSPTETSSERETEQLRSAPIPAPFWHTQNASDGAMESFWLNGTGLPESIRAGFLSHVDHPALDAVPFREQEMPWSFGIT